MTFGEFIKLIKHSGKISGKQSDFVIELIETSFGYEKGSTGLTEDSVNKWLQRGGSSVNNWIYKSRKDGKNFDHTLFINFLSSRTPLTWLDVQSKFREVSKAERPMIDCQTKDASVFWYSVLWQFKAIVGLAQNEDMAGVFSAVTLGEDAPSVNLRHFVSAPFLFSPIYSSRNSHTSVYKSAYHDRSTVVLSGKFENGKFLVISYGKIFSEHANTLNDVQADLEDTLYSLLVDMGGSFPKKRIGVSQGHKEQTTTRSFNRALKVKFTDSGISITDTSVDAIGLCDVFIIGEPMSEYSEAAEDAIISYVANGGAVVFCSNGWKPKKPDSEAKDEVDYLPVNRFGKPLGFKIEKGLTGKYMKIADKKLYFTPLLSTSIRPDDPEKIVELSAMNDGNSDIRWQLGIKYEIGNEVQADTLTALYWYKMSAFSGNANGQHRLSRCYMATAVQGIKPNNALVLSWLTLAAEQSNKYAQGNLGHAYQRGLYGLTPDMEKAVRLITASAEKGWAISQIRLGIHYEEIQDYCNAALWYTRAANNREIGRIDLAEAKFRLALLIKSGKGLTRDIKKAFVLLHESAAYGSDKARAELAMLENDVSGGSGIEDFDEGTTRYYDIHIFDGTKYAEFDEPAKQELLVVMSQELNARIGKQLSEYVGEEIIKEFDRIFEDKAFVDSEIERLNVKHSYLFRTNRLRLPESIADIEVARDVFPVFWLQHNCPDYASLIQEQQILLMSSLLNGTLPLQDKGGKL